MPERDANAGDVVRTPLLDWPSDELLLDGLDAMAELRADCCSARPAYRIALRDTAELLLCGHHYRKHAEALVTDGASVRSCE